MHSTTKYEYDITVHEAERASKSYLMSVVALIAGLPMPIINLLATFIFFIGNRKGTYFTRFHCTQALFSQLAVVMINSVGFWWTLSIFLGKKELSDAYIAYIIVIVCFNIVEFVATIYAAIHTRKCEHVELWVFGPLTHLICKPDVQ